MDDLDTLLADLGKPAQHEADTATVNMTELDDLMTDLNDQARHAPAAAVPVQPARAQPAQAARAPAPAPKDDLDDLLNDLTAPSSRAAPRSAADDLDALLSDLDGGSSAPPKAAPVKAAAPAPARVAAAPVAAPVKAAAAPRPAAPAKAVATDDLDDLLEGLDSAPRHTAPAYTGAGNGSDVDNMFNDINSSARAGGAAVRGSGAAAPLRNPAGPASGPARGTCAGCNQQIHGEVLQSMGKYWHPEHFACGNCHQELGTQPFFEYEGMPHCDKCYKGMFCPRCAKCDKPIMDRIITVLAKKWHPDCFTCSTCNQPFPGGSFFERDGYPYCSEHFYSNTVPNCGSCSKPVRGECTNALNQAWHVECFVCQYCRKAFTDGAFFEHQGKPYCKLHYHANTGSVCGGCSKAITGRSVNAMGKNWHPEHFVCAFCVNPLGGGNYTEKQGKPYCGECFANLFT